MPRVARGDAAEDVAAADDDRRLDAQALHFLDVARDLRRHGGIDAVCVVAHQRFAGQLQEDALVGRLGHSEGL